MYSRLPTVNHLGWSKKSCQESLNYSRSVEETASDPARDTHQQLAIHSESRKKGGDGTPNSSSTQDPTTRTPRMSTPMKDQIEIKKDPVVSFNEEDVREIFVVLLLRDFGRVVSQNWSTMLHVYKYCVQIQLTWMKLIPSYMHLVQNWTSVS